MDAKGRLSRLISPPGGTEPRRRQDLPRAYASNGAVYVVQIPWFRDRQTFVGPETLGQIMPAERSVDIDGPLDLAVADFLIKSID